MELLNSWQRVLFSASCLTLAWVCTKIVANNPWPRYEWIFPQFEWHVRWHQYLEIVQPGWTVVVNSMKWWNLMNKILNENYCKMNGEFDSYRKVSIHIKIVIELNWHWIRRIYPCTIWIWPIWWDVCIRFAQIPIHIEYLRYVVNQTRAIRHDNSEFFDLVIKIRQIKKRVN